MLDRSIALERLVLAVVPLLTVWGIWAFGIWDPWELELAEAARALSETGNDPSVHSPLSTSLIAVAFDLFGIHNWSGRLPAVLSALLSGLLAFLMLRRGCGPRAAVIGVAVMASTPLFLLNARLLVGDAIEVFAQALVGLAALAVTSTPTRSWRALAHYAFLALGVALSSYASGVLLGPLPPILAVAALGLLSDDDGSGNASARWLLPATAALLVLAVGRAVSLDDPGFSIWLGGGAVGGNPPSFDRGIELVFHGFAPWSAALPVAAVWALFPRPGRSERAQRLAWVLLLWAGFSFVSWTVFASRYGTPPFLALIPLAGLLAIWLAEISEEAVAHWPSAVVVGLLFGLLVRDYALYPDSPLSALPVDALSVPNAYNPVAQWSFLFFVAALLLCLTLLSHDGTPRPSSTSSTRWIRDQWSAGRTQRAWLFIAFLLITFCLVFGSICLLLDLGISSLALRVGRALFFVPFLLAALVLGLPWVRYEYGRLGSQRVFPALGGGLLVGGFIALSFQPALSQHFSPKPVYDAYAELTDGNPEPLASYKLPSTGARYYSNAPIEEISRQAELIDFLGEGGQRWAVIKAESLPSLDRAYRRKTGRHLFVADARSAKLLLIAGEPVDGRPNQSFIAAAILDELPPVQHEVGANYDDRIELVGYDFELPNGDSVGAGQRFEVTWYWRVLGKAPAGYQVFVHIDGKGLRLNGDHVPVGGRYPPAIWEEGDLIADSQTLTVPAHYGVGDYAIYLGWFSGSKRLEVKSGPHDGEDRVNVGALRVR